MLFTILYGHINVAMAFKGLMVVVLRMLFESDILYRIIFFFDARAHLTAVSQS